VLMYGLLSVLCTKKVEEDDVPGEKELGAINGYVDGEII